MRPRQSTNYVAESSDRRTSFVARDAHQNISALMVEAVPRPLLRLMRACGVRWLFMPGCGPDERAKLRAHGIEPLPFPYLTPVAPPPDRPKEVLFSFIGGNSSERQKKVRLLIAERFRENPFVTVWAEHYWGATIANASAAVEMADRYRDVMARTRFALCPAGYSPQSIRFYEALAAGAIPVVIADGWTGPEWDWERTCLFFTPAEFEAITRTRGQFERHLASLADREEDLRRNCRRAWQAFNRGALADYVRRKCAEPLRPPSASAPWVADADEALAEKFVWDRGFREMVREERTERAPTVLPLAEDRAAKLFEVLAETKSVFAACVAVGVGRERWSALLDTFPDIRQRAARITGAGGVRDWR